MRKDVLEGVLRHIMNDIQPNYAQPWPSNIIVITEQSSVTMKLELKGK
ncbi:hypothetical protein [Enterococcus malodoratus]|nr:hypothetical protein [Enterococcus malodoratus]